jgi:hypothetical protein
MQPSPQRAPQDCTFGRSPLVDVDIDNFSTKVVNVNIVFGLFAIGIAASLR